MISFRIVFINKYSRWWYYYVKVKRCKLSYKFNLSNKHELANNQMGRGLFQIILEIEKSFKSFVVPT